MSDAIRPAAPGTVLLTASHLVKTYGKGQSLIRALDDVSLEIHAGELLVILGFSGSGKSTLLNMLGGMDQPDSGSILCGGKDVAKLGDRELTAYRKHQIGFIFQNFNLIPELTALENTDLTADKTGDPRIAEHMLELVGLADRMDAYPSQMSGGQQQRVSIGRALMNAPAVVLADEPTGNLDSKNSQEIVQLLKYSNRHYGQTLIVITHDESIALQADRILAIEDGKIVRDEKVRA